MKKPPESVVDKIAEELYYYRAAEGLLKEVYLRVDSGDSLPQDLRYRIENFYGLDQDE